MHFTTEDKRIDHTLGFPVTIRHAPIRESEGSRRALNISWDAYQHTVLTELVRNPGPWTGDHVEFVRKWLRDTLEEFGARADVSKSAVHTWEQKADAPTGMNKGTEYLLRAQVAAELHQMDVIDTASFHALVTDAMQFDRDREPDTFEVDGRALRDDKSGGDTLNAAR